LIKTEISQILSNSFAARRNATAETECGGLMGYGEFVVEEKLPMANRRWENHTSTSSIPSITDWIAMSRSDIFTASPAVNSVTADRWVAQGNPEGKPGLEKVQGRLSSSRGIGLTSLFGGFYLFGKGEEGNKPCWYST
jgi:hypothetical protein